MRNAAFSTRWNAFSSSLCYTRESCMRKRFKMSKYLYSTHLFIYTVAYTRRDVDRAIVGNADDHRFLVGDTLVER